MAFEVETPSDTQAKVRIRVPREEIEEAVSHELGHLKERVRVKGFRPGKVPRQLIEKRYRAPLTAELSRKLLGQTYEKAITEHHLHPVEMPSLQEDDLKQKEDGSLTVELNLEVIPHIVPAGYDRFTVTPPALEWNEGDVDREIEGLRRQLATAEDIADGLAVTGDVVVADLRFQFLDGSSLPTFENRIIDTANEIIDGVKCEGVSGKFVGCARGNTLKLSMKLPEVFPLEEHRGKTAVVDCTVKDIRRIALPEVSSAEFLAKVGLKDADELRAKVRERLQQVQKSQQDRAVEELCVDQLLERYSFALPPAFVQRAVDEERERIRTDLVNRNVQATEVEQKLLELDGRMRQSVERRLRESHLLDRIAEIEDTQVEVKELEHQFVLMARAYQADPQRLFEHFQSQGLVPRVVQDIRRAKVRAQLRVAAAAAESVGQNTLGQNTLGQNTATNPTPEKTA